MIKLFIAICIIGFLACSVVARTLVFNMYLIPYYSVKDTFKYISEREWEKWQGFGIRMFTGYFGTGKSMLASKYICDNYWRFNDSQTPINVISNIPLAIPYTPLINMQQIIDVEENTIIFIDECNTLFNARSWKDFPVELIYQLCQNRKKKIMLIMTAPRFHLVDKSIRDVTQYVYNCRKPFWRVHTVSVYDGWDMENAVNVNLIKPLKRYGVFARDRFYDNYDSYAIIDNVKKEEFLSKEEILQNRQGIVYNPDLVRRKSRKMKKIEKK